MRTKLTILTLATLLFAVSCSQPGQSNQQKAEVETTQNPNSPVNYVVLTSNIQQIRAISEGAQMLKAENPEMYGKMEVIVCGRTVKEITNSDVMEPILKAVSEGDLDVKVCGFSVREQNVDSTLIPPQFTSVENGIWYSFKKQAEGFRSLGL